MSLTNNIFKNTISETFAQLFQSPLKPEDEFVRMLTKMYEQLQFMFFLMRTKAKRSMNHHARYVLKGDSGIGTIEMVLILVVLIALVLVFKGRINDLLTNIFDQIDSSAQSVY